MDADDRTYTVRAGTTAHGSARADAGDEVIRIDVGWGSPPSGLPGPAELLATSFAACLLKNLERSGRLLNFRYASAEVDVIARRQDDPPRFVEIAYAMRVVTDEPARRVDLVHRNLQKYGTVYNTLAAVCDVHGELLATTAAERGSRADAGAGVVHDSPETISRLRRG